MVASSRFLNAAYIHLDSGDFQRAEEEAASAYDVAEETQDYSDGPGAYSAVHD